MINESDVRKLAKKCRTSVKDYVLQETGVLNSRYMMDLDPALSFSVPDEENAPMYKRFVEKVYGPEVRVEIKHLYCD